MCRLIAPDLLACQEASVQVVRSAYPLLSNMGLHRSILFSTGHVTIITPVCVTYRVCLVVSSFPIFHLFESALGDTGDLDFEVLIANTSLVGSGHPMDVVVSKAQLAACLQQ
jgi:hypothetical protein